MHTSKKPFPIYTLCGLSEKIDSRPDYQRPPVWIRKQKQLLIDTILRDYDIPKVYFRRLSENSKFKFEVIDGQQRLRAIWEFKEGEYSIAKDAKPIDGTHIAGQKYDDLNEDLRIRFDSYPIDVVIVEDSNLDGSTDDEVLDMFLRLQSGTKLKAQEKRNAMKSDLRDFVKKLAQHKFFTSCNFKNKRFAYDHVAAQLICIEDEGGPANVRDRELNLLYEKYHKFDEKCALASKVKRTLNFLYKTFPENDPPLLERYNVIALYCICSSLIDNFSTKEVDKLLRAWFIKFEGQRRLNDELEEEHRDKYLVEYRRRISQSTDSKESIRSRVEFLQRRFFLEYPDLTLRDSRRSFTHEQRLAIYLRDEGRCQIAKKCSGTELPWKMWHADHIIPHADGGKTTVANGQVACPDCNQIKGASRH